MILIAESGSTKTDWRIGKTLQYETIGLNPYFVNSHEVTDALLSFLGEGTKEQVSEVHFYGTGITNEEKGAVISEGILRAMGKDIPVFTYSDVVAAAKALWGNGEGIACILGTGSNSCHWDGRQISFQVPPLGFWLGDEGSGGHIGKSLILGYLHKEMPKEIRNLFEDEFGAKDRLEILHHAYQIEKPNRYFAGYCHFVAKHIQNPYLDSLVKDSFNLFFDKYLLKYPDTKQLAAVGSIACYFEKQLQEVANSYGLAFKKIVQKPIDALVDYHIPNFV